MPPYSTVKSRANPAGACVTVPHPNFTTIRNQDRFSKDDANRLKSFFIGNSSDIIGNENYPLSFSFHAGQKNPPVKSKFKLPFARTRG
jgi:hypothetical protein